MVRKNWLWNPVFLLVGCAALALSIFRPNNPVWIAAWIAPVFLIRFVRSSRWAAAAGLGFLTVQAAIFVGMIPLFSMVGTSTVKVDAGFMLIWQIKSGMLLLAPATLVPFLLDKALYTRLPRWATALVYPTAVVVVELLFARTTGTLGTFGESQYSLRPLVMTSSLFGLAGISFLISWSASIINDLWEGDWSIRNLGRQAIVYAAVTGSLLLYGGLAIAFPLRTDSSVPIAGITTDVVFEDRMGESGLSLTDISKLSPAEYARIVRSSDSQIDEMRRKTTEAIERGAKIIVWQEVSLLLEPVVADSLLEDMQKLADTANVYLLVSYERLLGAGERQGHPMRNCSVLFTPEGERGWEYAKAYPAAGFEDVFTEAGTHDIPAVDTPYGRIGQVICADMFHPYYLRQAGLREIDLLLVPSWDTMAYTPFITFASAFRAVENGFTMIRIAGEGHSGVIDPYYRHWAGQDSFFVGAVNFHANIPVVSRSTVYTAAGFAFPYLATVGLMLLVGWAIIRNVRAKSSKKAGSLRRNSIP